MKTIKQILKRLFLISITLLLYQSIFAIQNRAGEITYQKIGEYKYLICLSIYTGASAGMPEVEINFGDGNSESVTRLSEIYLPNDYKKNYYQIEHQFSGPGTYIISIEEPGRNTGIRNIPNSVNTYFSLKSILQISQTLGGNNSSISETPPFAQVLVNSIFTYRCIATDTDGDSLSYKLVKCLGKNGQAIENYSLPEASSSIEINAVSGELVWEKPQYLALYNIAIEIEEWRQGTKIASTIRDIQFEVVDKLTGIADLSENEITIYPNPTSSIVRFDFAGNEVNWIKIIDLSGKLIATKTSVNRNESIDISKFPNGIYFVLIKTDEKEISYKLVKTTR